MLLTEALGLTAGGIIASVGAGGKTSLLSLLCSEWQKLGHPFLLTTTTKMFLRQVEGFNPVISLSYELGVQQIGRLLHELGFAAWFSSIQGDKVIGLPPHWVDLVVQAGVVQTAFVEADGAKQRLIKAPGNDEPKPPGSTKYTLGVLNIGAIGQPLAEQTVHRLDTVLDLLEKVDGDKIEPKDLAILAGSSRGIFKDCPGEKVLVICGACRGSLGDWQLINEYLTQTNKVGIQRVVLTQGFGVDMKPVAVREVC